ncbi:MAG: PAS domain-containing protein [Gemmatimonadaceae bacterium]
MALATAPTAAAEYAPSVTVAALIGCDRKGRVTVWNEGATTMFGYTADEMLGQSYIMLVPPRFRPGHEQAMRPGGAHSARSLVSEPRRWIGLRKDDSEFYFDMALRWWAVAEGTCIAGSLTPVSAES